MRLTLLDNNKLAERQAIAQRADQMRTQGICPTCRDMEHGDVYPPAKTRIFYENDLVCCMLEAWPRNPGHTIILVKPHFEDLSEMPVTIGSQIVPILHITVVTLKEVLGAEKVYLCTMCDGRRNHLHFQLIPRMPGDAITGSKLFVKDRCCLEDHAEPVERLRHMFLHFKEAQEVASPPE